MEDNNFFSDIEVEKTEQSVLEKESENNSATNLSNATDEPFHTALNSDNNSTDVPINLPSAVKEPKKVLDKGFKAFVIILAVAVLISACSVGGLGVILTSCLTWKQSRKTPMNTALHRFTAL